MNRLISQLVPFILIGIALVAFAFGILLLSYLFFLGAIVGFALFAASWIKNKFFPPKTPVKHEPAQSKRIIDSDDWKEL